MKPTKREDWVRRPLAIDLFCGLGGWTDGLLAEGYEVIGFDIEKHHYGDAKYPAQLVIQDVLTLHGSQFKDAALIVASPPCQAYSYRAMPWKRAKALPPPDNSLFEACFRIQREACEAAKRYIPLVVESVRGAQKWVGRSRWNFGSFHLWGDVPALMPIAKAAPKVGGISFSGYGEPGYKAVAFNGTTDRRLRESAAKGMKIGGGVHSQRTKLDPAAHWSGSPGRKHASAMIAKIPLSLSLSPHSQDLLPDGIKQGGDWFSTEGSISRTTGGYSKARKAASAMIAKIPLTLSQHIARTYHP